MGLGLGVRLGVIRVGLVSQVFEDIDNIMRENEGKNNKNLIATPLHNDNNNKHSAS